MNTELENLLTTFKNNVCNLVNIDDTLLVDIKQHYSEYTEYQYYYTKVIHLLYKSIPVSMDGKSKEEILSYANDVLDKISSNIVPINKNFYSAFIDYKLSVDIDDVFDMITLLETVRGYVDDMPTSPPMVIYFYCMLQRCYLTRFITYCDAIRDINQEIVKVKYTSRFDNYCSFDDMPDELKIF